MTLNLERNPERNPTLTRFYESLPDLPAGLEDGAIALCPGCHKAFHDTRRLAAA